MTFCICHSSSTKSVDVATQLELSLQIKISSSFRGKRFQLEDETKVTEACKELDKVQFAVILLDNQFLSILDHKKSKRLYAKIAEMLPKKYCGQIVFFALDVEDQRLQEFREDFDNGGSMQLMSSLSIEEMTSQCYQIYTSITGPPQNQCASLDTGITADGLNSDSFNRMSISSFQNPTTSRSGELVRQRPLVAVEDTYSSGNMTSNSSGPLSFSGPEKQNDTSLNHHVNDNVSKVQHETATPCARFDQLTISGTNPEADNLPFFNVICKSGNILTYNGGIPSQPYCDNGTQQNRFQQRQPQTKQMLQSPTPLYHDHSVPQNSSYQQHVVQDTSNQMFHQNHILGQPPSHHNSQTDPMPNVSPGSGTYRRLVDQSTGAFSPWSFPQSGTLTNIGHGHRREGEKQPYIPVGYSGSIANEGVPIGHQANIPVGQGVQNADKRLPNPSHVSSQCDSPLRSTDNNDQSFLTSYVRADNSVNFTGDGICVVCRQKKELSLPVVGMGMDSMPFSSVASFGPEAMPCLSGFGYCLPCAITSIQKQGGASRMQSIESLPTMSYQDLLSLVKSEEGRNDGQRLHASLGRQSGQSDLSFPDHMSQLPAMSLPLNILPNSHQNNLQMTQVPLTNTTISTAQQTNKLSCQSDQTLGSRQTRNVPVGQSNASVHPNAPAASILDRSTVSLPVDIETGSSGGAQRYSADGRSASLPTIPAGISRLSSSPEDAYPSVTDNTRVPPTSSDQNGESPRKRNSGTCTSEDAEGQGGAAGVTVDHDGSGAENRVSIFELSQEVFGYIRDILDYHDQRNWTNLASIHGWNYGQISDLKRKWRKRSVDSPFEYLVHEFQNYTVQELKEDLIRIPREDVLRELRKMEQKGKLPQGCNGLFT